VVFDPPYVDLRLAPEVKGVVAWGAHDPGVNLAANPPGLRKQFMARVGPYPAAAWTYGRPWPSADATRAMAGALTEAVNRRAEAARWLLTEVFDDWDLGIVVVGELHSAAEGLWHGIDPDHPLHDQPSARVASDGLARLYRAVDRLIGGLIAATDPMTSVVFSLGGMGSNDSDVASMALLPELLLRWSLGERLLNVPDLWAAEPGRVPIPAGADAVWEREWYPRLAPETRSLAGSLAHRLPAPVRRSLKRARSSIEVRRSRPPRYLELDWQPAVWYQPWWSQMRAFALPSFYDGRIRVNLQGRERHGLVAISDYQRVCDEIEQLVRDCRDPRTGESVVGQVRRPANTYDPLALDSSAADLVIEWNAVAAAIEHPEYGLIGPLPYLRTGGHTGPFGFAFVDGAGVEPGDRGVATSGDVAATIAVLLSGRAIDGMPGSALALHSVR